MFGRIEEYTRCYQVFFEIYKNTHSNSSILILTLKLSNTIFFTPLILPSETTFCFPSFVMMIACPYSFKPLKIPSFNLLIKVAS